MLKTAVRTIKLDDGAINIVRYNSNGQYFLAGGQNREITLVNPNSGGKIKAYSAHGTSTQVTCLQSRLGSPRHQHFRRQRKIRKRRWRQGCVYPSFPLKLIFGSFLWDVATGKTIKRFLGHTHRVNTVDFNSDATVIASGSYDSSVRIWDCK